MKNLNKNGSEQFSNLSLNNFYMIKLIAGICPGRLVATVLQTIINYFSWIFYSIIFIRYLLDSMDKKKSFAEIASFIALTMILFLCLELFSAWYNQRYRLITDQKIYQGLTRLFLIRQLQLTLAAMKTRIL